MAAVISRFIDILVSEEIRRIVAEAVRDGAFLSVTSAAVQVLSVYPNCGLSDREVADEVMMAAARAGVAVQIGRPIAA